MSVSGIRLSRPILSSPLTDILWLTLMVWAGFLVVVAGIAVGIAVFDTVTRSVWEPAAQLAGWYAIFIGGYLSHDVLALHVTHGQTRREFAQHATIFIVVFAAVIGVLMTLGYLLERLLYRLTDWPHRLENEHLYSSTTQVPAILAEFWLMMLVWTATGAFVGASIYRFHNDGLLAIAPAMVPIGLAGLALGDGWGPVASLVALVGDPSPPPVVAIGLCLAGFALALAMAWPIVRDIPIRTKSV